MQYCKLHHSGFVIKNISFYEKKMLFERKIKQTYDPEQKANLALYKHYSDSFIELIEPVDNQSFVWNSLQAKGDHFHHFCYEVQKQKTIDKMAKAHNLIPILGPINAILFNNRKVYFFYTRTKQVVEFLLTD